MRKLLVTAGLLAAIPLLLPSAAVSQNKADRKNAPKQEVTTEQDYTNLGKAKEATGKISYLDATAKTLTLTVTYQTSEPLPPKPGQDNRVNQQYNALQRQQQRLANDYQSIMRAKNPVQQQQRLQRWQYDYQQVQLKMQQLAATAKSQFKTVNHTKDYELDIVPEPKVSRLTLPMEYDDKGNVKEYTKEELKKMRDKELPGYTAKFEDVQVGQTVKVYLIKPAPPKKSSKKDTDSEAKKDGEEAKKDTETKKEADPKTDPEAKKPATKSASTEKGADDPPPHPRVRAIVIQTEADPAATQRDQKKKKQNDQ
jgi:hypothetical protein